MTLHLDDGTSLELNGLRGRLIEALVRDVRLPDLLGQFGCGEVALHYSPAEVEVFWRCKTSRLRRVRDGT